MNASTNPEPLYPPFMTAVDRRPDAAGLLQALRDVVIERDRQDHEHGGADHDDEHGITDWADYISRHLWKGVRAATLGLVRRQLVRIAALAVAAIQAHDRRVARGEVDDGDIDYEDGTDGTDGTDRADANPDPGLGRGILA